MHFWKELLFLSRKESNQLIWQPSRVPCFFLHLLDKHNSWYLTTTTTKKKICLINIISIYVTTTTIRGRGFCQRVNIKIFSLKWIRNKNNWKKNSYPCSSMFHLTLKRWSLWGLCETRRRDRVRYLSSQNTNAHWPHSVLHDTTI